MRPPLQTWQDAERLRHANQLAAARAGYESLLGDPDWTSAARLRLAELALAAGGVREATAHALAARASLPPDPALTEAVTRLLFQVGELQAALACATSPVVLQADDPEVLAGVGQLLSDHSFAEQALPLLERARQLGLERPAVHHLIAQARVYTGDLPGAERELEACLQRDPDFAPALRDRAKLRRQTDASQHVAQLRAAIVRAGSAPTAPLLQYALFKELDDLGQTDAAWQALSEGMRLRRRQLVYDVAGERALFDHLLGSDPGDAAATPAQHALEAAASAAGPTPIFIVGMPRSGTTLLERILGTHDQVTDAGELRDFICQLRWTCDRLGGPHLDLDLARHADRVDWGALGRRYLAHTQWRAEGRGFYTDKLPTNFTNVGYIARSLPQARILHMVREPMDTCFSNLKEVFADAYPHSYDQIEMAEHFLRYQRLMAHWHARFPGRILDVHYDALVADPAAGARQVLEFCGLPWDPAVVAIESRRGTVATASTAQVREPIHQRFVGQWRRYAAQLQPMRERLAAG